MERERLDDALAAWAESRRLDPARASAIERAIVEAPVELDHGWWAALSAQVTSAVVGAPALPDPARAAMQRALGVAWG